ILGGISEETTTEEKMQLIENALNQVVTADWLSTISQSRDESENGNSYTNATAWGMLMQLEETIASLTGTKTIVENESGETVTGIQVLNALLSVTAGSDALIVADRTTPPATYDDFENAFAYHFSLYDVSKGNVHQLLRVPVILVIPIPETLDLTKPIYVLHYPDGAATYDKILPSVVDGDKIEILADSFSTFVLVNEKDQTQNNNPNSSSNTASGAQDTQNVPSVTENSPKTYDGSTDLATYFFFISLGAAVCILWFIVGVEIYKRRKH
ncbi:MAG: hypothetical protein LBM69_09110, partial [Lachnospiraceae bacterium]|nr:hypothetical protein [Lachnospiraceae bacterium]